MTSEKAQALCLALLKADSESAAIEILTDAELWGDESVWRLYGDRDSNYATIGNQQSRPEAALVEKIVNSVDARLLNHCLSNGINPTSPDAPQSIRAAVARFFEGGRDDDEAGRGSLQRWAKAARTAESSNITLASTGPKSNPCLTLVDLGEGQSPNRMPDTFLSIDRDNKLRIPFVQGKFNMGGTGALKFCGSESLQLVISRRNPAIVSAMNERDESGDEWGFTIVRRERPTHQTGAVRNSVYSYLAPLNAGESPRRGGVLRFKADSLPLMPKDNQPYVRAIGWGSAVKLYEYDMKGFSSHILMKDGLLYRLEILLPEIALPVSLHECRDYRGKAEASFVTTLAGLTVRLEEGKGGNLEEGFPSSVPFTVDGEAMVARIYAFKKGRAETYRTREGVIFTINGQTHGDLPKHLFGRKSVKLGRLTDSLLMSVDCSEISVGAREDLFMNSRDRLSSGQLRKSIEKQIEDILHQHPGLRQLANQRREAEVAERLHDSKPLENVLGSILKSSPTLAALLLRGVRLSTPHRPQPGTGSSDGQGGANPGTAKFVGKRHPTYFRFFKKSDGETLLRSCEIGRQCRLSFETDVENDYFSRVEFPGKYHAELVGGTERELNHSLTLHDGRAYWNLEIPDDAVIGDCVVVQCQVSDETLPDGFVNVAKLTLRPKNEREPGNGKPRSGEGSGKNESQSEDGGLTIPEVIKVREPEWRQYDFDKHSAAKVVRDEGEGGATVYTFYVNVDNICLKTEMKYGREEPALTEAKFVYGNVLLALAILHDNAGKENGRETQEGDEHSVESIIETTTKAIAPFLVPMINQLGGLSADDINSASERGDDD